MSSISILLLGDSLTEGYTNSGKIYHSYGIQLKKRFEESGKDVEVKTKKKIKYRFLIAFLFIHKNLNFTDNDRREFRRSCCLEIF